MFTIEIWKHIFSYCYNECELLSLSRTCKMFNKLAIVRLEEIRNTVMLIDEAGSVIINLKDFKAQGLTHYNKFQYRGATIVFDKTRLKYDPRLCIISVNGVSCNLIITFDHDAIEYIQICKEFIDEDEDEDYDFTNAIFMDAKLPYQLNNIIIGINNLIDKYVKPLFPNKTFEYLDFDPLKKLSFVDDPGRWEEVVPDYVLWWERFFKIIN